MAVLLLYYPAYQLKNPCCPGTLSNQHNHTWNLLRYGPLWKLLTQFLQRCTQGLLKHLKIMEWINILLKKWDVNKMCAFVEQRAKIKQHNTQETPLATYVNGSLKVKQHNNMKDNCKKHLSINWSKSELILYHS